MGTNYYLHEDTCPCCKRSGREHHIGKSSIGWAFALHVDPKNGIDDLWDWVKLWQAPGNEIRDEYGLRVSAEEMFRIIACRREDVAYSQVDGRRVIRQGIGTWDCHVGPEERW